MSNRRYYRMLKQMIPRLPQSTLQNLLSVHALLASLGVLFLGLATLLGFTQPTLAFANLDALLLLCQTSGFGLIALSTLPMGYRTKLAFGASFLSLCGFIVI